MNIEQDSIFLIGKGHPVCQDYALSGVTGDGTPYIIVSDGCSGSAHSDVGARLLAHAAVQTLPELFLLYESLLNRYNSFGLDSILRVQDALVHLPIEITCLDATLLVAAVIEDQVVVFVYGDGVVMMEKTDGTREIIDISFTHNAPYYLSYLLDLDRRMTYLAQSSEAKLISRHSASVAYEENVTAAQFFTWPLSEVKTLVLSTDGATSFNDKDVNQVANEVLALKTTKGEFLTRRVRRFVGDWAKQGISHYDDLGMAAFSFTHVNDTE
jgi:hypothetical protein